VYATRWEELERAAGVRARMRMIVRRAALAALRRRSGAPPSGLRIVHYHYVFDDERDGFARQLDFFARTFEPVSLSEGVRRLRDNSLTGRELAITFDDGFRNLLTNAAPLLVEHGLSSCVFILTELVDAPPSQVAEICRERLYMPLAAEPLSWEDVRALVERGQEIGSHTRTHPNLARLPADALVEELESSRDELARRLGSAPKHFSAPYGNRDRFSPAVSQAARASGYVSCASAERGVNARPQDVYALRRDHLLASWSIEDVRFFLSRG
jgi:peptidoglycan/xylan/chitin deacetylase (PgdA/CDA1 family)